MNKDVIYIDTEDDITAIIGKVKSSRDKIVALVPPKRIGVLQSAVNLRLLARTAENADKHLVIVTNNKALSTLSAMALIPVAKNLQSKPEIAEIAALEIDDGDDIIDGAQLPVGDHARTVKTVKNAKNSSSNDDNDEIELPESIDELPPSKQIPVYDNSISSDLKKQKSKDKKVPDFNRFRKRLFIGGFLAVCLAVFLVWAIVYAPAAKIIITAKTSDEPVSLAVKLGGTSATDITKNTIQTITKQTSKDATVDFDATGQKDIGEKATGMITIENCDSSTSVTIAAGTTFISNSGKSFTNAAAVTVPGFSGSASACRSDGTGAGSIDVKVTAAGSGESYNIAAQDYVVGGISGDIYAHGAAMSGGTTKNVAVVTASDVAKATEKLSADSSDTVKSQLAAQFTAGESVIKDSFLATPGDPVSTPAVGAETATGKAKLTVKTTYSMIGIAKSELQAYIKNSLNKQIADNKNQRIYSDGIDKVKLSGYSNDGTTATVNIATVGQVGPDIDDDKIKDLVKGMSYGDVQALISKISGVSDVDVKFSYFWVRTVPNDAQKINVEFKIQNG